MTPEKIIEGILRVNGKVWIEGDILRHEFRADLHWVWIPLMRDSKAELMVLARRERETAELEQLFTLQDERQTVQSLERKTAQFRTTPKTETSATPRVSQKVPRCPAGCSNFPTSPLVITNVR